MKKSISDSLLIVSVTPYFLERSCLWFEENLEKILAARKPSLFSRITPFIWKKTGKSSFPNF